MSYIERTIVTAVRASLSSEERRKLGMTDVHRHAGEARGELWEDRFIFDERLPRAEEVPLADMWSRLVVESGYVERRAAYTDAARADASLKIKELVGDLVLALPSRRWFDAQEIIGMIVDRQNVLDAEAWFVTGAGKEAVRVADDLAELPLPAEVPA